MMDSTTVTYVLSVACLVIFGTVESIWTRLITEIQLHRRALHLCTKALPTPFLFCLLWSKALWMSQNEFIVSSFGR
uniref:Uncharacterized protein n=1 Tax=Pararge aegeria TaxID=116150 RepID=S4PS03_9NEOP